MSKTEDNIFPFNTLQVNEVTEIPVVKSVSASCPVINEWDVNELCDLFEANAG